MASLHMTEQFDPYYVTRVLAEIMSRESGQEVIITLTPKNPANRTKDQKGEHE